MTKKQYIFFGIILAGVIGVTILLTSIFGGSKKPDKNDYKEKVALYERLISQEKERTTAEVGFRIEQKQQFDDYMHNDSIFKAQLLSNQARYIPINNRINEIPKNISRIANNDDSIRAAFAKPD